MNNLYQPGSFMPPNAQQQPILPAPPAATAPAPPTTRKRAAPNAAAATAAAPKTPAPKRKRTAKPVAPDNNVMPMQRLNMQTSNMQNPIRNVGQMMPGQGPQQQQQPQAQMMPGPGQGQQHQVQQQNQHPGQRQNPQQQQQPQQPQPYYSPFPPTTPSNVPRVSNQNANINPNLSQTPTNTNTTDPALLSPNTNPNQPTSSITTAESLVATAQTLRVRAATAQTRVKEIQEQLLTAIDEASRAVSAANEAQARANDAMAALTTSMTLPPAGGHYRSFEELLEAAQRHAAGQGYALSAGRRRKRKDGKRSLIEVICARGGAYRDSVGGERKRRVSTRKTGCTFSFNAAELWEGEEPSTGLEGPGRPAPEGEKVGKKDREVGPGKTYWEIRYKEGAAERGVDCAAHNHLPEWEEGKVGKWGNKREIGKAKRQSLGGGQGGTPVKGGRARREEEDGEEDGEGDAEGSREQSVLMYDGRHEMGRFEGEAEARHVAQMQIPGQGLQGQEQRGIGMYQPPYYGHQ